MKITDQMVRAARETFDDVSGPPLELATNDAWRAALEAALAVDGLCLVQVWQPIESAPKDGTEVLIYQAGQSFGYDYAIGKFGARWEGDQEGGWGNRNSASQYNTPTRWMPLPPPPAASTGDSPRQEKP